jgi:hypothetical protein
MVIVSHDRDLLGLVDQIADLSGGTVRVYGGNLAACSELVAIEQAAAQRAGTAAAADVRRERRDVADAEVKQARRDRQGRKAADSGSLPRIVASARKRHAQESAGRSRELHAERLAAARDRLADAEEAVRDDAEIRVELPATAVPAGRTVLAVSGLADRHRPAVIAHRPDPTPRPSGGRPDPSRRPPRRSPRAGLAPLGGHPPSGWPARVLSARLRGRSGPVPAACGVWGNWQPDGFWPR